MKNKIIETIIIKKVIKDYFLTIGDDCVDNRWAVTRKELLELLRKLKEMEKELLDEKHD